MGTDFKGQSGIIYTTTVKEVETIAQELRKRGLKVGGYHAQLEPPERRSRSGGCVLCSIMYSHLVLCIVAL